MKILKYNESFSESPYYEIDERIDRKSMKYYFESDNKWIYEVGFHLHENNTYFFGFKAKKPDDYFFDFEVLTNDNPFKVLSTIGFILENHYGKYKPSMYMFSVQGQDKKIIQKRINVYLNLLKDKWICKKDEDMNKWYFKRKTI